LGGGPDAVIGWTVAGLGGEVEREHRCLWVMEEGRMEELRMESVAPVKERGNWERRFMEDWIVVVVRRAGVEAE
jgi:hypothetical protein